MTLPNGPDHTGAELGAGAEANGDAGISASARPRFSEPSRTHASRESLPASGDTDPDAIRTEGLSRDFGRHRAVDRLTFTIPAGRVVAMLGPNGAGKTTLLKLLLGLIEPTEGQAIVLGHPARDMPSSAACRLIGMGEGHEPPRWASLSSMVALQADASPRFDAAQAAWLLEDQGLQLSRRYGTLSKGQKRWSLVALALASGADVLLLDEPADGLDPSARIKLYDHLRTYANQRGATVLVTTHIIGDIERAADDVAIINNGKLSLYASLEDIREHVREIELPDTRVMPALDGTVRLLGRRLVGTTTLAWVICDLDDEPDRLQRMAGGKARVRTCSLESVYMAVSEYSPDFVDGKKVQVG